MYGVRVDSLKPQTTYYYKVTSMGGNGQSDGVESSVNHFTSAAPGQVTSAFPQPE
jgi:chitodextrinase